MKFTIDSFKTVVKKPGEYIFSSQEISHLISDYSKHDLTHDVYVNTSGSGLDFTISVVPKGNTVRVESEELIVKVQFEPVNPILDSTENIVFSSVDTYKVTYSTRLHPMLIPDEDNACITYWQAVNLLNKISTSVFKMIQKIEYQDEDDDRI